jgi:hypothetical protein
MRLEGRTVDVHEEATLGPVTIVADTWLTGCEFIIHVSEARPECFDFEPFQVIKLYC